MKIDKTRFVALTSLLAAATGVGLVACEIKTTNTEQPAPGADATPPPSDASPPPDAVSDATPPPADATPDSAPPPDAADAAPTCLGDDGTASCAAAGDAGASCLGSPAGQTVCTDLLPNYKKGVLREMVKCLSAAPTCEAIPDPVEACATAALAKACPDPTTAAACKAAADTCVAGGDTPTITPARCEALLAGMTAAGRTAFASCAAEGCGLLDNFCFVYP